MGFGLSPLELLVVGIAAVLLFGNKLPSVARSLGKSVTDFKKGMSGIEEEFRAADRDSTRTASRRPAEIEDREEATAPKFEPPTSEPKAEQSA
jgi:sec-independent protein translocase protein TatA